MVIPNLKFFIGGGRYSGVNFDHLKSEVFHWGGGGAFWSEIPERDFLENLDKKLLFEECVQECACASQIVSHMWRLIISGRSGRASRQDHFFSISESFSIKRTAAHPRGKAEY